MDADAAAADVVDAGAADAGSAAAEDAESVDADAELDAGGVAAAVAAAAAAPLELGACLGVVADPGAERKQPSLKSAVVGAGENRSDPALILLCAVNAARYGTPDRVRVTETVL